MRATVMVDADDLAALRDAYRAQFMHTQSLTAEDEVVERARLRYRLDVALRTFLLGGRPHTHGI